MAGGVIIGIVVFLVGGLVVGTAGPSSPGNLGWIGFGLLSLGIAIAVISAGWRPSARIGKSKMYGKYR